MNTLSFKKIFSLTLFLALASLFAFTLQAWTGPTASPPGSNVAAPINVGTTDQVKDAGLSVNALTVFGSQYIQNKLGINVTNPLVALDVAGSLKLGNGGEQCQAISEGVVKYNSTSQCLQYCNGTDWKTVCGTSPVTDTVTAGTNVTVLDKLGGYSQNQCYDDTNQNLGDPGPNTFTFTSNPRTLQVDMYCRVGANGGPHLDTAKFWITDAAGSTVYASSNLACSIIADGEYHPTSHSVGLPSATTYTVHTSGSGCNGSASDSYTIAAYLTLAN